MKRKVILIYYSQRAPVWWNGVIMIFMKKGSEFRTDLGLIA